ncbi:MAG: hypothetical protein U9Q76_09360 [candidate division WOR-3 bacterium]|nr:hypothetical protein [candidate division WOR-3 bacterium]
MGSNALYFGIELVAVYPFHSPIPCLSVDFYNEQGSCIDKKREYTEEWLADQYIPRI